MTKINLLGLEDNLYLHLHQGKLYAYKTFDDWASCFPIEDCTIKVMVNGQPILLEFADGYLQNFKSVVE